MIAAGGTGGHVYPALAVAEALVADQPDIALHFVGTVGGFERPLVEQSGLAFADYSEVRAGPLHGVNPLRMFLSLFQLMLGILQAFVIVLRRRPDVLLLTGGWVGLPVAFAAWLMRVPSLLYVPDIEPGLSLRVLRFFVQRIALNVAESVQYFAAHKTVVTGYPVRQSLQAATREAALEHFALDPACKTVLVFGGSRGARSINNALLAILPELLDSDVQIIHITGTLDWDVVAEQRDSLEHHGRYHAFPYLHEAMGMALAAADVVVSRAGASVLGEFPLFGLASILIPYPHAWRYQKVNADYLVEHGAAVRLNDEVMADDLLPTLTALLDDPARLTAMRSAASRLAQPESAWRVGQELMQLAGGSVA
ncbi:MAG: UDP-N-acetylglucosamine--N-acetylmuramyl-(pentapeptide) pyrophosphoryl-undecaprenol N-acetylglucosamine transferase [Chloroflexi bacterium]|nr:MAG: UDP-N-acetylglucosamine--N-acetylmuramyl-(pentapeptide) pyrophosphoryl-undecaprenol N-acetylglucosamine transferase [Chloroflexota bacterium]